MQCPACRHVFEAPPAKRPLTRRQRDVLDYILWHMATQRCAPTMKEIASHFEFRSLATVHMHLSNLEAKGYLSREVNRTRAMVAVA